ncbi:MAG: type II secretion system F family protein [Candidatus Tumulicola sp.]
MKSTLPRGNASAATMLAGRSRNRMVFYYAGRAPDGKLLRGSIEADSRDAAAGHLRSRAVFVTTLETVATVRGAWTSLRLAIRRNGNARAAFFRSFAALVGAGVPVRRALETLIRQSANGAFSEALESVAADVESGSALSTALERHPKDFSRVAAAMIKAGEIGGSLDEALRALADLEERDRGLRRRVAAALAYPCVVSIAAGGLLLFLIANTMPAFATMFAEMHLPLPLGTRLLIRAGEVLQQPWSWACAGSVALLTLTVAGRYKASDSPWAAAVDRARFRVPIIGAIAVKSTVARFARTLGSLLHAGVDIVAALEASAQVVEGFVYRDGLRRIVDALRRGETLVSPFEASALFDATFLQLLRAGEESGSVDAMLLKLANYYELDVETTLGALTSVLEPVLICALGAAIGTIVASIILPLYSMIGNIQ